MSDPRDELADILMSEEVMHSDGYGRDYALAEADAILAAGYRRVNTRDEATVHQVTLVMAEHHRLDPYGPYDRCTCGYKTPLGHFYSTHIARAVLTALEGA